MRFSFVSRTVLAASFVSLAIFGAGCAADADDDDTDTAAAEVRGGNGRGNGNGHGNGNGNGHGHGRGRGPQDWHGRPHGRQHIEHPQGACILPIST